MVLIIVFRIVIMESIVGLVVLARIVRFSGSDYVRMIEL
jgi:hypothetical protein